MTNAQGMCLGGSDNIDSDNNSNNNDNNKAI